jgi:PhoPQ-activated pathogenicity-related protein
MFDGRVYVNTQVCCYLGVGLGGLDAVCEIVVDFFGILSTIITAAIPIPGIRILAGSTGSYYGGEYAEEIYDYFTNSVQAAQANPQIATALGIDMQFLYLGYQCQQQYPLAIFRLLVHIKTNPL